MHTPFVLDGSFLDGKAGGAGPGRQSHVTHMITHEPIFYKSKKCPPKVSASPWSWVTKITVFPLVFPRK